jgi:hypothetical protein
VKFLLLVFLTLTIAMLVGCRHNPSYSDEKTDGPGRGSIESKPLDAEPLSESSPPLPASATDPSASPSGAETTSGGTQPTAPGGATQSQTPVVPPDFLDTKKLQIKGLPRYPRSRMVKIQFGPMQGYEAVMMVLTSRDQFDKVTAFYDAAIKNSHWAIAANDRSPDNYSWTLGPSPTEEALVRITRDEKTNLVTIVLDRVRQQAPPK